MNRMTLIQWILKWYPDLDLCPVCAGKFIDNACHPNDGIPKCSACRDRGFFHDDGRVITYKRCDDLREFYRRIVNAENRLMEVNHANAD